MSDFQLWLNQTVWVSNTEKVKRRVYIPSFAEDITAFMKKKGYQMDYRWKLGHMAVARWLYAVHVNSVRPAKSIHYPQTIHRDWEEDKFQFYHIIGFDDLCDLLRRWQFNEDLDMESRVGNRTLQEFHRFLWGYIDLESSKQGDIVATRLEDSDSDSENGWPRRRVDAYIQDSTEGYHGGAWAKV